uniref:3'-5' exonuclease domain-containing protein n=1 Tax=Plectus sambesii TaxID=2011161 RepID=A0A914VFU7_9BILA
MSDANFGDLIQGVLEVDPTMRRFVVDYLGDMEDPAALRWARRLREPSNSAASSSSLEAEPQFRPVLSETFVLSERIGQSISMVDTKEGLTNCLNHVFASSSSEELVIGLDTEFVPGFLALEEQVALLQIATKERIFLIDLYTLENQLDNQDWIDSFHQLLCNNRAIKIGFEFLSDLRILNATLPFCRDVMSKTTNVVCLAKLIHNLCQANASFYYALHMSKTSEETVANNPADIGELPPLGFGLSDLCAFLLGQPLDKSWQLSHWTKRPLRAEQMDYAALDAYCLIEIFDELKKKAKELSIDWEDIVVRSTINLSFTKQKRVLRNKLQ